MAVTKITTDKAPRKHGVGRYVANFLLIAFNILMLVWAISTQTAPQAQCVGGVSNGQVGCEAAGGLVAGFGLGVVIFIWIMGEAFLVGIRRATR